MTKPDDNDQREAEIWAAERYGTKFTDPDALLYRDGAVFGYSVAVAKYKEIAKEAHDWGYETGQDDIIGYQQERAVQGLSESFAEFIKKWEKK